VMCFRQHLDNLEQGSEVCFPETIFLGPAAIERYGPFGIMTAYGRERSDRVAKIFLRPVCMHHISFHESGADPLALTVARAKRV